MSTNHLYDTWYAEMRELRPAEHTSRLRSFVWLMVGLFLAQSVHLGKIAWKKDPRTGYEQEQGAPHATHPG